LLEQLQEKTDELLLELIYNSLLLDDVEWYSYGTGADMQQQLHSLATSYLKRCSQCPATTNAALLEGLMMICLAFGSGLTANLSLQYSLAAVRAALAPWMVLLGRLMRVLAGCMRQKVQQVLDVRGAGGVALAAAQDDLSVLITAARQICMVGNPDAHLIFCWLHGCADKFTGQEQHPGPPWEVPAGASSSSRAALLRYPKYHLQQPNMPVPATSAVAVVAGAEAAAGGLAGQAGEVAVSTGDSRSSAALGCVLLDDLDSWHDELLLKVKVAARAAVAKAHSAGLLREEGSSSSTCSSMQPTNEGGVLSVLQELHQLQLPERLSAAGLALCNSLAVP
jgi:hypothetical protein